MFQSNNSLVETKNNNINKYITLRNSFEDDEKDNAPRDSVYGLPFLIDYYKEQECLKDVILNLPSPRVVKPKQKKIYKKKANFQDCEILPSSNVLAKKSLIKKPSIKNDEELSNLPVNRSFVVFEKQRYKDINSSFIQTNVIYDSEDEDLGNRSTLIKPHEILSKQELSNLIKMYEPRKNENPQIRKNNSSYIRSTNNKKDSFTTNNNNIINTNNNNINSPKEKKEEIKNSACKINKMPTKSWIDDAFDSPREKESRNLENFEEDNDSSNFHFYQKDAFYNNMNNLIPGSNNFELHKEKKSEIISDDEDDFIFDGRNRHVFSFYNKTNSQTKKENLNDNKKTNFAVGLSKFEIETINEHPNENILNLSSNNLNIQSKNETSHHRNNDFVLEKNLSEKIIPANKNVKDEIEITTVNNFELNHRRRAEPKHSKNGMEIGIVSRLDNASSLSNPNEKQLVNDTKDNPSAINDLPVKIKNFPLLEKKRINLNKLNLEGYLMKNNIISSSNNDTKSNQNKISSILFKDDLKEENTNLNFTPNPNANQITTSISNNQLYATSNSKQIKEGYIIDSQNASVGNNKLKLNYPNAQSNTINSKDVNHILNKNNYIKLISSLENNYHQPNLNLNIEQDPIKSNSNKFKSFVENYKLANANSKENTSRQVDLKRESYSQQTQEDRNTFENKNRISNMTSNINNNNEISSQANNKYNNLSMPLTSSKKSTSKANNSEIGSVSRYSINQTSKEEEDHSYSTLFKKQMNTKLREIEMRSTSNISNLNNLNSKSNGESVISGHNITISSSTRKPCNQDRTTSATLGNYLNNNKNNLNNLNEIHQRNYSKNNGIENNLSNLNYTNTNNIYGNYNDTQNEDNNKHKGINLKTQKSPQYQQFVVLQKQLPYSKYNLDLLPKTKAHDEKEVLYNNVADYQTLNQLINSVKKAYNHQLIQFKKNNHNNRGNACRSTSPQSHYEKLNQIEKKTVIGNSSITKNFQTGNIQAQKTGKNTSPNNMINNNNCGSQIKKINQAFTNANLNKKNISNPINKNFIDHETIDENTLIELLEEIKERSNKIQKHFKEKEENMNNQIKELNENIKSFQEKEKNLREEIDVWKSKLAFFIEDFRKKSKENKSEATKTNLMNTTTKSVDDIKCDINFEEMMKEMNDGKIQKLKTSCKIIILTI